MDGGFLVLGNIGFRLPLDGDGHHLKKEQAVCGVAVREPGHGVETATYTCNQYWDPYNPVPTHPASIRFFLTLETSAYRT